MATHKVPQDVETDDKLIGFLSLKQFIFTVIGLGFGYLTFFFFTKVHPVAALIWLPFTLVFMVLGLYQRKDQPAEVFLASALGFYLKPKVRVWSQDGYDERVHITAPPVVEKKYTKDFTGEEARGRLANLSLMMDSRGWASKRVDDWQNPQLATVAAGSDRIMSTQDVAVQQGFDPMKYAQPADPYDDRSIVGKQFETKIVQADNSTHQQALNVMQQASQQPLDTSTATSGQVQSSAPVKPVQPPAAQTTPSTPTPPIQAAPALPTNDDSLVPASIDQTVPPKAVESVESVSKTEVMEDTTELNVPHQNEDGSVELKLH